MIKKLHHSVSRFYLRAWSDRGRVWCLQAGRIFRAEVRNVAAENYFYRLKDLNSDDVSLIRELAITHAPEGLKPILEQLLRIFRMPHAAREALRSSGETLNEYTATVNEVISNLGEDLHTSIEEEFRPYLESMVAGNTEFDSNPRDQAAFFRGLAAQYLRTNWKRRAITALGQERFPAFDRISNVLVHMWAVIVGFNLFADRERLEMVLFHNSTDIPFITSDQPVINISSEPFDFQAPEKFDLYYPLSPKRAMLLVDRSRNSYHEGYSLRPAEVDAFNLQIAVRAHQQIFASSGEYLAIISKAMRAWQS